MRSYLAYGSSTILLLGAGVLVFGTGSFASGWTIGRWGANVSATVHNSPLLIAAMFHIAGVIASATEQLPEPDPVRRRWKLFAAYVSAPVLVFSLFLLSINGIMPQFFINGVGWSPLRQTVMAAAFILFVYSSSYMMTRFLWKKELYLYWYSLALALLAVMIICFYIQPAVGSPVGWVGRSAQYLAGIYFIVSVVSAKREAQMRGVSLNEAVAELFLSPGFHWQDILKNARHGFSIADTRGKFLEVNEACCRILGYTRTELLSMTLADVEVVESPFDVLRHGEVIKEKGNEHFITQHRRKDGSIIDVEINATYHDIGKGQVTFFLEDITDRKQAEEALHNSKAQLDLALLSAHMGMWYWDIVNKKRYFDNQVCHLLGIDPTKFTGAEEEFMEVVHPDDVATIRAALSRTIEHDTPYEAEYRVVWSDGSIHYISTRGMLVRDYASRPVRINGIIWDITDRKRAENDLKERTAKLEEINRELESFSYSISHDLRAPLRAMDGYARMILKKEEDRFDEDTMRKFKAIRSNSQMMGKLIDDILTLSRLGRAKMSIVNLEMGEIINDVWKVLQTINPERNMTLTVQAMPAGYGDRTLIRQVYANLFINAVKFTKYKNPAQIEAGGYIDGNANVYYVKDNGVGFDMAYYDKLFGIFQRLHSADDFEGTGVGLATVQRAVSMHGGHAWAEGKVDEGATFYFSLPHYTHAHKMRQLSEDKLGKDND